MCFDTRKSFSIYLDLENELYRIQLTFTCSRSTTETLEKGAKYVQS